MFERINKWPLEKRISEADLDSVYAKLKKRKYVLNRRSDLETPKDKLLGLAES